jgi:hypothetical protein
MSVTARRHLQHEALVGGVSNTLFNGLIAWWLLSGGPALAWWGQHSFGIDILATAFLLPFIVALIVIPLQRRKLSRGKLQAIDLGPDSQLQGWVDRLPFSVWGNALLFGLIGLCLVAPLTLAGFHLLGVSQVPPAHYAMFKGVWAGLVAALLVIPMSMSALRAAAVEPATLTGN